MDNNEIKIPLYFVRAENDYKVMVIYSQKENIDKCYELVKMQMCNSHDPEYVIGFFENVYSVHDITSSSKIKITDLYNLDYEIRQEEPEDGINNIDSYFYDGISIKSVIKTNIDQTTRKHWFCHGIDW